VHLSTAVLLAAATAGGGGGVAVAALRQVLAGPIPCL